MAEPEYGGGLQGGVRADEGEKGEPHWEDGWSCRTSEEGDWPCRVSGGGLGREGVASVADDGD